MNPTKSVLGVSGMCWVHFRNPNTISSLLFRGSPPVVLGVLGLASRTRMCVIISISALMALIFFLMREPLNPTHSTHLI